MVTKRANGPPLVTPNSSIPPYPTTPIDSSKIPASTNSIYSPDLNTSPAFDLIDMNQARSRPRRDSDVSSHGTWDSEGDEDEGKRDETDNNATDVPKPLRVSPSKSHLEQQSESSRQDDLPAILKPGPVGGMSAINRKPVATKQYNDEVLDNPWAVEGPRPSEQPQGRFESNNPYFRAQPTGGSSTVGGTFSSPSHAPPPPPSGAPPPPPFELPATKTPVDEMTNLSLGQHQKVAQRQSYETAEVLQVPVKGQAPLPPVVDHSVGHASHSNPWANDTQQLTAQQKWDDFNETSGPMASTNSTEPPRRDQEPAAPPSPKPIPEVSELPRRGGQILPPPISTTHVAASPSIDLAPETPGTAARRQRSEHYQIKHINWYDTSSNNTSHNSSNMRRSPILTQNANGPCPLLALVNALVLTTPRGEDTALIETLRTREQVSLGLLLDAVFDELMSGRRNSSASTLPDVGELYAFLLALHTGMNVNPRFITSASTPRGSLDGHPPNLDSVHPVHRAQNKAGCFEETKEMSLYSTFTIPLIHGWIPPTGTPAYKAFERCAQSFEDAQNIQFAESELEDKMRSEGLSSAEQQTFQDIRTIKSFLTTWPTQLTDYGLQTIVGSLRPGQFAILFRNDHFSTVYKEPTHGALMTLVTDAGYSSHEEIVWESLVDVNGAASELFSGDFRVVSHDQDVRINEEPSTAGGNEGWQTVQSRNRYHNSASRTQQQRPSDDETPPPLPGPRPAIPPRARLSTDQPAGANADIQRTASEQEDHDLALALQLQEEEEAQQRQDEDRRRREQHLSEQFLSQQSEGRPPTIPPRRGGSRQSTSTRPPVTRPAEEAANPDAPPTYEQSASDRPYREGGSNPQGSALTAYDALRRQQQQQGQQSPTSPQGDLSQAQRRQSYAARGRRHTSQTGVPGAYVHAAGPSNPGRRPGQAATAQDADDKCVLM